jgi:hypothetical protein
MGDSCTNKGAESTGIQNSTIEGKLQAYERRVVVNSKQKLSAARMVMY